MTVLESPPVRDGSAPAPTAAESFGRYLRRERELRGITLEQIAETTRIGLMHLRALESEVPDRSTARVFVVGYLRAYARAIGLDEDETVLRFEECYRTEAEPEKPVPASAARRRRRWVVAAVALALLAGAAALLLSR
jgi:cytoskeletal protein RodZ